jgi:uncharacterized protein YgiM (DUF1202 family)
MKKLLLINLLFIFSVVTVLSQPKVPVVVITKQANVRDMPSVQSKVVGKVKKGDKLTVSASESPWFYVTNGKLRGWIHGSTIEVIEEKEETSANSKSKNYRKSYKDEWLFITKASEKDYYYNPSTMVKTKSLLKVWTKKVTPDEGSTRTLMEINCSLNSYRVLRVVFYNTSGSVSDDIDNSEGEFKDIIPDTVMDAIAEAVCGAAK